MKESHPPTIAYAARLLGLQVSQMRLVVAAGEVGEVRPSTKAEQNRWNLPWNTKVICDWKAVERLKKIRDREGQ